MVISTSMNIMHILKLCCLDVHDVLEALNPKPEPLNP